MMNTLSPKSARHKSMLNKEQTTFMSPQVMQMLTTTEQSPKN